MNKLNEFPSNPLLIFSLVERIRTAVKGDDFLSGCIKNAFVTNLNYYQLVKEIQEMIFDNTPALQVILGKQLAKDVSDFYIPQRLLTKQK